MDIYPEDLGAARQSRLLPPEAKKQGGPLWSVVASMLAVLIMFWAVGAHGGVPLLVLVVFAARLLPRLVGHVKEQVWRPAPLTRPQVQVMLTRTRDPLEKEYLDVVLAAVSLPRVPEPAAETQVREAMRSLGTAIEKLPATSVPTQSALKLAGRASSLAEEAEREPDPVVAATLLRRAETRQRQAETMLLIETMGRRSAALRQELSDQLDSLQTSLAAFRMAGVWSTGEMAEVSASIQWVARKAQALAAAQVEMDDLLHAERLPSPHPSGSEELQQRLLRIYHACNGEASDDGHG